MKSKGRSIGVALWCVFHLTLIVLALRAFPWEIDSSLYSILPDASSLKGVAEAEKKLSENSMSQVNLLFGHENYETAKNALDRFDGAFRDDERFESVNYKVSSNTLENIGSFIQAHRYALVGDDFIDALQDSSRGVPFVKANALQRIYGAFSMSDLTQLEEDPFLIGSEALERVTMRSPLTRGRLMLKDERLVAKDSLGEFILWSAKLKSGAAGFASEDHVLTAVLRKIDSLKAETPGLIVAKSGVPFHSYESSRNAQSEVTWISSVSFILMFTLLIAVFRSPRPIFQTVASITVGVLSSLAATWTLFGSIHIFTFIFGTSIIGISIDYAIHFFTEWRYAPQKPDGFNIRSHILKGLLLGFMTTELGYVALTFAPFPLLKQMATFSMTGLLSSLLTIVLIFPFNRPTKKTGGSTLPQCAARFSLCYDGLRRWPIAVKASIIGILLVAASIGISRLNIHTDLRNLYTMSDDLKQSEMLAGRIMDFGFSGDYFIINGETEEDVLQKEERFTRRLDAARRDSLLKNFLSISYFLASQERQSEKVRAIEQTLAPAAAEMLKDEGFESDTLFRKSLENFKPVTLNDSLPEEWKQLMSSLWIGKVGNAYYSAVLPLHLKHDSTTTEKLKAMANEFDGVTFISKMPEINATLTQLSNIALKLVACAIIVVLFILVFAYNLKTALRIISIPISSALIVATLFGYAGIDFNFFAIAGIILTLGIGIDYSLFFRESSKRPSTTALAVTLSATTTLLSFGTLSLSHFAPVSTFGLSIFIGIVSSFLLSPLSKAKN